MKSVKDAEINKPVDILDLFRDWFVKCLDCPHLTFLNSTARQPMGRIIRKLSWKQ